MAALGSHESHCHLGTMHEVHVVSIISRYIHRYTVPKDSISEPTLTPDQLHFNQVTYLLNLPFTSLFLNQQYRIQQIPKYQNVDFPYTEGQDGTRHLQVPALVTASNSI